MAATDSPNFPPAVAEQIRADAHSVLRAATEAQGLDVECRDPEILAQVAKLFKKARSAQT